MLGLGSALLDLLYHVDDGFLSSVPGNKGGTELVNAAQMAAILQRLPGEGTIVQGGSAANTIVALAKLGGKTSMLAKIGDDDGGETYKECIRKAGVSVDNFKVAKDMPNGRCLSLISPDSERTMRTCMAAAETMTPDDISEEDFANATHFYIEGYTLFNRDLLLKALDLAKNAGLEIHFDLAAPEIVMGAKDILPDLLRTYVHAVYANEMEAAALSGQDDPVKALDTIAGLCPLPIVKLGKKGAILRHNGGPVIQVPAKVVNAVDTTAAGDLWAAGFLHGYLNGWPLDKAAWFGSLTSAEVVQVTGSVLPDAVWEALRKESNKLQPIIG